MISLRPNPFYAPPAYQTKMSAGFDICSSIDLKIMGNETRTVATGLYLVKPNWFWRLMSRWVVFELQIRPRSGLAAKWGITVLNTPGTVDSDYPEEIKVLLHNTTQAPFDVRRGDRIAQGIVALVFRAGGVKVKQVERTSGCGSTGV
jgi:dUTP pyrophosphatase